MNYTVKSGDTMYKIATQFGVSLDELMMANPEIANPDLIYPGQVIVIPNTGVPGGELPILGMPPGRPPAILPPGFPPGGMMPVFPPGDVMPVIPPGGMIPGLPGEMGATMPYSLKTGDRGNEVKYLQKRLKELGYYNGSISGHFGTKTKRAVRNFQKDCRAEVTGIADQNLLQTLG